MADEGFKRKLAAILSADVIGYSRLMRDDEEATVRDIAAHRVLITEIIQQHNGRVVDSPGDNILAEFASVVDAVNGAIKIQSEIKESNTGIHQDRRMEFRIGINLGDVIDEGDRIYGDGVNIAARVEGLAAGGGIAISGAVYEQIKDKLSLGYHYLGEKDVKNIPEPVRIYRLLPDPADAGKMIGEETFKSRKWLWAASGAVALIIFLVVGFAIWNYYFRPSVEPATIEKMAFPLPEKPSIAILPFDNIGGEAEQEYFSDGLADNIIMQLSQYHNLFVIARNSSFTYKGKPVKVRQVAEELGVKYVLEGSVQRSDDRVRVTAQLIDAITGRHLWAERYERELKDIFAIQDEISAKIISELGVVLVEGEQSRLSSIATQNVDAWTYKTKGVVQFRLFTKESNLKAREFAEKAIELDPNFANAYSLLGWTYAMPVRWGISKTPKENLLKAEDLVNQAQALDASNWDAQNLLGFIYSLRGQYDRAIQEGQRAIELAPNVSDTYALLALSLHFVDRQDEAIAAMTKAMRLAPFYPRWFLSTLGKCYFANGQYEEAAKALEQYGKERPNDYSTHIWLAVTHSAMGSGNLAREHVEQALSINPAFCIEEWNKTFAPWKNREKVEGIFDIARNLGIPDKPPQQQPDKPSIAVLPFVNMSGDPDQEYFSDGLTDELIGDLAKISGILVISRNSAFTYKGKQVKIVQIAKELNVRYVLEGSVQKSGNKVRIRAQLIDGQKDHHLWAESYDGEMNDIFDLQDKITGKIVSALAIKLSPSELERISNKGTDNIFAYEAFLKGEEQFVIQTPESFLKAIEYYKQAIEFDSNFSRAYAAIGNTYQIGGNLAYSRKMGFSSGTMRLLARKYLELAMKNPSPEAYSLAAAKEIHRRNFQKSITYAEKAYQYAPNSANRLTAFAWHLIFNGRTEESIELLNKAIRLDPVDTQKHTPICFIFLGVNHFIMGNMEESVTYLQKALSLNPKLNNFSCFLAAAHAHLGNDIEAKKALSDYLKIFPKGWPATIRYLYQSWPFKDSEVFDRFAQGLVKAGLPADAADYYKLNNQERLSGQEVKKLLFGKTSSGYVWGVKPMQWSLHINDVGEVKYQYRGKTYIGKAWIEDDNICLLREQYHGSLKSCEAIYHNPDGDEHTKTDYFRVTDYGLFLFAVEK